MEILTPKYEKLSTIQKRNNLNEVYRVGGKGPGGAYHDYQIRFATESVGKTLDVPFQIGPRTDSNRNGILDVDLLEIVRDRLKCFQDGEFATRENAIALTHIEEALLWMNKRVEDRAERNVLGTYEK